MIGANGSPRSARGASMASLTRSSTAGSRPGFETGKPSLFGATCSRAPQRAVIWVAAPPSQTKARAHLLDATNADRRAAIHAAGKFVGLRGEGEILERIDTLVADAAEPPLPSDQRDMIEAVLAVRAPSDKALAQLRGICPRSMAPALGRMERRLDALAEKGVDPKTLPFDATFGRSLEYYDGFVFEFRASDPTLPPLGGGGRYDALTTTLGGGAGSTAVGGVVRPEAMIAAERGA